MRYRWKHRICGRCLVALRNSDLGYVTNKGREVKEGLEVAHGMVGLLYCTGSQFPPPSSKLSTVCLPPGAVKIRATATSLGLGTRRRTKRWIDLETRDLAFLSQEPVPVRQLFRLAGPAISGCYPMVSAATNYNRFKALLCRVFRKPPPTNPRLWSWAGSFKNLLFPDYDSPPPEMSIVDWIQSMPSRRRKALEEAARLYELTGWCDKYCTFHAFIKEELLPGFKKERDHIAQLDAMVDRLINAPHDVTHIIAGPKIKPYLKWLKKQWHWDNYLFYASVGPDLLQQWLDKVTSKGERLVFWSDYSMFDASHNAHTWDFVEHFYRQHFADLDFLAVLAAWRAPGGKLGDLRYQAGVMNASGRDDTALANAILNGVAMVLAVTAAWFNIPLFQVTVGHVLRIQSDLQLAVCGDDALGFLPWVSFDYAEAFVNRARKHLTAFGFSAKMFCSNRFEDAVFLAHRPLPVRGRYYWAKTLGRCLYKLGWQVGIKPDPAAEFNGICQMYVNCASHVPILSDIAKVWLEVRKGSKINAWKPDPDRPWELMGTFGPETYSDDTIEAIARSYSLGRSPTRLDLEVTDTFITRSDILDCIAHVTKVIRECGGRPCVLDHWLLAHMVAVDEQ